VRRILLSVSVLTICATPYLSPTAIGQAGAVFHGEKDETIDIPLEDVAPEVIESFDLPPTAKIPEEDLTPELSYLLNNGIQKRYEYGADRSKAIGLRGDHLGRLDIKGASEEAAPKLLEAVLSILKRHEAVFGVASEHQWVFDRVVESSTRISIWFHQEIDGVPVMQSRMLVTQEGVVNTIEVAYFDPTDAIADKRTWMPEDALASVATQSANPKDEKTYDRADPGSFSFEIDPHTNLLRPVFTAPVEGVVYKIDAVTGVVLREEERGPALTSVVVVQTSWPVLPQTLTPDVTTKNRASRFTSSFETTLVVLSGDSHNAWTFERENDGKPAAVEFAGHSVASLGMDKRYFGDPVAIARSFTDTNPKLKWCDTSRRGYMVTDIRPDTVSNEWLFLHSRHQRSL